MAQQDLIIGAADAKNGDTYFSAFTKTQANFTELYALVADGKVNNKLAINEFSDFPDPLLPNIDYVIGGNIIFPDILPATWNNLPSNIEFSGSIASSKLTYNGTGDFLAGVNMGFFKVNNVRIDAPNARIYNITETTTPTTVNLITASVDSCASYGNFDVFGLLIKTISVNNAANGMVFGSKSVVISLSENSVVTTNAAFKWVDLGSAVVPTLEMTNVRIAGVAGSVMLSGLANSANISPNQRAGITSCEVTGGAVALGGGITEDDIRYDFEGVTGVRDSDPDSLIYLNNNPTPTVITAASTDGSNAVKVAGVWVEKSSSQFVTTADGRITALFENDVPVPITSRNTVQPVSGTNKKIAVYIAINGVVQAPAKALANIDSGDPKSLTVIWQETMNSAGPASYVELFVENQTDATNILVSDSILRLR